MRNGSGHCWTFRLCAGLCLVALAAVVIPRDAGLGPAGLLQLFVTGPFEAPPAAPQEEAPQEEQDGEEADHLLAPSATQRHRTGPRPCNRAPTTSAIALCQLPHRPAPHRDVPRVRAAHRGAGAHLLC
jgi:hypothetical protein